MEENPFLPSSGGAKSRDSQSLARSAPAECMLPTRWRKAPTCGPGESELGGQVARLGDSRLGAAAGCPWQVAGGERLAFGLGNPKGSSLLAPHWQ